MKTQTLRIALSAALFAGATLAGLAQAASLTTLEPVQVRPAADQIAQQTLERNSDIRTLTAVQVRPWAEQLAALAAEQAKQRIVTLLRCRCVLRPNSAPTWSCAAPPPARRPPPARQLAPSVR